MDLIVTKYIAMEATVRLVADHYDRLRQRFPEAMLRNARQLCLELPTDREQRLAAGLADGYYQILGRGGIFTALWQLAETAGSGLEVDLRAIPIRQETVEICEFFDLNPYNLLSGGSLLIAAADSRTLLQELERQDIPGSVIGSLRAGNDRIIRNDGHVRYLDRPQPEELEKLYQPMESISKA